MGHCGIQFFKFFKSFIAISVFIAALGFGTASDGSPAAAHRALLFDMLPLMVQDAYVGFTLANMIWLLKLACAAYQWIEAAAFQLYFRISVFAGHGFNFLEFFVATIYSWSLLQKPYVDTAVVRASGIINDAKTVRIEIIDASVQLHSRLEVMVNSTLAHCVYGFLASAVLLLLLIISAVGTIALRSVVINLCYAGRRVHWRKIFLLSITSVFGYVGYLWAKDV